LEWHRRNLEAKRDEDKNHAEQRCAAICSRISQRLREPVQICLPGHAEKPRDSIHEKRRGEGAEHQIFRARFQSDRIAPGKADEHIKRYRHQLDGDKDEDKIDGRYQIHQSGTGEDWHCEKLAESVLRTGKRTAYNRGIVDHHHEDEDRG
jgi:hypothetical protein